MRSPAVVALDQVGDDLGIGLGAEPVALELEVASQLGVVLDDAVGDDLDLVVAVSVRVGVLLGDASVGGPAGVRQADRRQRRRNRDRAAVAVGPGAIEPDGGAEVGQVAHGPHGIDPPVLEQRDAGRVIASVLELLEPGHQQVPARALAHISDDSAHGRRIRVEPGGDPVAATLAKDSSRSIKRTRRPQTSRHSSAVGASTITRTRGSVPEGRTRTRPRPSSPSLSRSTASQTAAACSSAARSAISTFSSTCGSFRIGIAAARSPFPSARMVSRAAAMPSPVGPSSSQMMCPDCSPPSVQPRRSSSLATWRSPTGVVATSIPASAIA